MRTIVTARVLPGSALRIGQVGAVNRRGAGDLHHSLKYIRRVGLRRSVEHVVEALKINDTWVTGGQIHSTERRRAQHVDRR